MQCPYRHFKKACSAEKVCPNWTKRHCTNKYCPMRHPGSKESATGASALHGEVEGEETVTLTLNTSAVNVALNPDMALMVITDMTGEL